VIAALLGRYPLAAGGAAPAQAPLADGEEQRRRAQDEAEARQRLQDAPQVRLQAPEALEPDSLALPAETPSFRIDRFVLGVPESLPPAHRARGASRRRRDPFHFAQAYLEQYRGRRIGAEGIRLILRRLTRRIIARGYTTTRVEPAEQDLAGGTLELTLIPGVIQAIRCADPAQGGWRCAFPARPGDLLNLRDLEQGLEQLKRVPGQDVAIAIRPGARPGESEVVLTLRRGRPWSAALSVDDSGLAATGKWQAGLHAAWGNPLGCSDLLSAGLNHDVTLSRRGLGTQGGSLAWSVPLGYWSFTASGSRNAYSQRIAGTRGDYGFSGESSGLEVRAVYLLGRGQSWKDTLQLRAGHRLARAFLDGAELEVQRRRNSNVELSLTHTHYLGQAQLDLTGAWRQGVSWFGAQPDLQPGGPTFHYRLQTLDATLAAPFSLGGRRLQYSATVRAQHTRDPLYAVDHLTLGNRWTVRGFDGEATLGSDNGGFLRNDLACPLGRRGSLYLGVDLGRVYGANEASLPGHSLAGMVLGLKGALSNSLSFNLFAGGPLHRPDRFPNPWPVVGASASLQF